MTRHRRKEAATSHDLEWHVREMAARMEAQSLPIEQIREELRASGVNVEETIARIAQARANANTARRKTGPLPDDRSV